MAGEGDKEALWGPALVPGTQALIFIEQIQVFAHYLCSTCFLSKLLRLQSYQGQGSVSLQATIKNNDLVHTQYVAGTTTWVRREEAGLWSQIRTQGVKISPLQHWPHFWDSLPQLPPH